MGTSQLTVPPTAEGRGRVRNGLAQEIFYRTPGSSGGRGAAPSLRCRAGALCPRLPLPPRSSWNPIVPGSLGAWIIMAGTMGAGEVGPGDGCSGWLPFPALPAYVCSPFLLSASFVPLIALPSFHVS
jgi:hypothetical protein